MSRTIKFRAWDAKRKKMMFPRPFECLREASNGNVSFTDGEIDHGNYIFFCELVMEQFTGLHDKNGREIYEGDVILLDSFDSIHVIEWGARLSARMIKKQGAHWPPQYLDAMICDREVSVIGNIHENPELLEGK